ncbi:MULTISPECIES: hypothetical protein [Burkholderia]|uniref:hypothetical protein n=1 Tax=Burkholderia TaxID=32008 RepID=UPI000B228E50|nr:MULTISPECIES: hypothetical protein [Burkholderia]CAG2304774.1 hypothetical protein BCCR75386_03290 [Burkholderia cenocepacia]MBR8160494.1 hypothetical protein [Burkholderia vietnamiensis]MCA8144576.1 hypothetical protein [Burkholderia vietnamiensis]QJP72953.1 hypothetical protein HJC54_23060 [Burkholderia glumae]CAG2304778.1 hypothetical protein BCCR75387_03289 [Burkholderia cenocepacia]
MASKVRTYAVHTRNGHGNSIERMVGQSKKALELEIDKRQLYSPDVKIEGIVPIGWATVEAAPTEDNDGVEFHVGTGDQKFIVRRNEPGFTHIVRQCPEQVRNVEDYIDELNAPYDNQ